VASKTKIRRSAPAERRRFNTPGGDAHQCDAANEETPILFRPIKVNTAGSVWTTNLTVNP
jgi:hypothetical protein